MQGPIDSTEHCWRFLLISLTLLGALLVPCASAWANATPELTVSAQPPLGAGYPSIGELEARQSPGGAESIVLSSATPAVCEIGEERFAANEALPLGHEVRAEVEYLQPGLCTFLVSVPATGTTEAAETSKSVAVPAVVGGGHQGSATPLRTHPEVAFEPPSAAYAGSTLGFAANASRPGLTLESTTPATCSVGSSPGGTGAAAPSTKQVRFGSAGACSLTASLPKTSEHEALVVTKPVLVVTASFTSTPPKDTAVGGSYQVSATSAPGLSVYLGAQGACSFAKLEPEQRLPERGHSVEDAGPPQSPATVYFAKTGTCTITAGGQQASERVSQSFSVAPGPPEQLTYMSKPPKPALVGESYRPSVRSSLGWGVSFSSATPSVCKIVLELGTKSHVALIAAGTCTIDVRIEEGSLGEAPEAKQSFRVQTRRESINGPGKAAASIPAKLRAVLLRDARQVVKQQEERAMGTRSASAVRTTYGEGESVQGGYTVGIAPSTPVYLVVIRGEFLHTCHGFGPCGPDHMLVFEVATQSPEVVLEAVGMGSSAYPNLKRFGVPAVLATHAK